MWFCTLTSYWSFRFESNVPEYRSETWMMSLLHYISQYAFARKYSLDTLEKLAKNQYWDLHISLFSPLTKVSTFPCKGIYHSEGLSQWHGASDDLCQFFFFFLCLFFMSLGRLSCNHGCDSRTDETKRQSALSWTITLALCQERESVHTSPLTHKDDCQNNQCSRLKGSLCWRQRL